MQRINVQPVAISSAAALVNIVNPSTNYQSNLWGLYLTVGAACQLTITGVTGAMNCSNTSATGQTLRFQDNGIEPLAKIPAASNLVISNPNTASLTGVAWIGQ